MTEVMIAVQARSTSTRLPGKATELIDTKTMTDHVLSACDNAAAHLNSKGVPRDINAYTILLVPEGDLLSTAYKYRTVVEGPEEDVLTRYMIAVKDFQPDYVVRITGDCVVMTSPIINKHITTAVHSKLDYCANVFEDCRTYVDGLDVEVMSVEYMNWLHKNASTTEDREHVTTYGRKNPPSWAKIGAVIGHIDLSHIKLSVDTYDELERARENILRINDKIRSAKQNGRAVYRF